MNLTEMTPDHIESLETIEAVREIAGRLGVKFSGNTGISTLKAKAIAALNDSKNKNTNVNTSEAQEPDISGIPNFLTEKAVNEIPDTPKPAMPKKLGVNDLLSMDAAKIKDPVLARAVVRAQALKLTRVKVTNLNPADAALQGGIITVQNKYVKVSRYIPYGGDEDSQGYHVEQIILNRLLDQKFPMRKEIKGNRFGVKQYRTVLVPKFSVQILPPLTKEELKNIADRQAASS